jgi:hypothetical protein
MISQTKEGGRMIDFQVDQGLNYEISLASQKNFSKYIKPVSEHTIHVI